jgi:histone deacetylase 6
MPYIDWAVANGFGVIDINFPLFYSSNTDTDPFAPKSADATLQQQTKELLCYIWDNYLEINSSSSVTLMGVGDAYTGMKQLLTSRGSYQPLN